MAAFCRRCDAEISRTADVCPECGYDPGGSARDVAGLLLAFGLFMLLFVPALGVFALFLGVCLLGFSYLTTPTG